MFRAAPPVRADARPAQPQLQPEARPDVRRWDAGRSEDTRGHRDRFDSRGSTGAVDGFHRAPADHRTAIAPREWHGRDVARRDLHHWREGHWIHGHRGDHYGWWWVIGPAWYFYDVPVYPYPVPDTELLIVEPETVVEAPPADVCREFRGDAVINDTGEPFYGTACLMPDGQWHIVTG